jgi:plasmid stabilization system protein ParE
VKRFRFHPEARIEARDATTWYRERSREAARGFTSAVTEGVQSIREHPEAWATWHGMDVRRRTLRRFPYSIFYIVENDMVVIVAVAHHKRRPGYWLPRLGR